MYWLWQRQPQTSQLANLQPALEGTTSAIAKESFQTKPPDTTVVITPDIKFEGKTSAGYLVVIYSNDFQVIKRANDNGDYSADLKLSPGLNLLDIVSISQDLTQNQKKSITLYYADSPSDEQQTGQTVFAGLVKSIFDTLLSVTTAAGDRNIRTSKSTEFEIPDKEEQQSTESAVKNVRIGDYAIALGNFPENSKDKDTIISQSLEIIRDNKPQNTEEFITGKIISNVKNNLFSVKNNKDGKIIEFALNKDSNISVDGKNAKTTDVTKDKTAIFIFHQSDDKNIADLIYLTP